MNPVWSLAAASVISPACGPALLPIAEPPNLQPTEVVREPLALAAARERQDGPITRARELLELWLGLLEPARGDVGGLGAEGKSLVLVDARQSDAGALSKLLHDLVGRDVQVVCVLVVERGGDILPVVGERRREVLVARDQHCRVDQLEERMEVLDREQLRDIRTLRLVLERGDFGQLAVLWRELGRRRDLDQLGVAQRALREGREPPQRLDLVAEQVDAHRTVLGRWEQVEQAATNRELTAVLDLVDALVPGCDEVHCGLVEVEQLAHPELEPVRPHRRVWHLFRQRDGADDDHRRGFTRVQQRIERGDS